MAKRGTEYIARNLHKDCERLIIRVALHDWDDHMARTTQEYYLRFDAYLKRASNLVGVPIDKLRMSFDKYNKEAFESYKVVAIRWDFIGGEMYKEFGGESVFAGGINTIKGIYNAAPPLFGGVKATLLAEKKAGLKVVVVTHAYKEWAVFKARQTGVADLIDHIIAVHPSKKKSPDDWAEGAWRAGEKPENCFGSGDNVKSDGQALYSAGVRTIFLTPSNFGHFNEGEIPNGAMVINRFADIPRALHRRK